MSEDLQRLQDRIRRDPPSYQADFVQQYEHFKAAVAICKLDAYSNETQRKNFEDLVRFVSHVAPCFPSSTADAAAIMTELLDVSGNSLPPHTRKVLVSALILLRNRGMLSPSALLPLFFKLFRIPDKSLREQLFLYIVTDIRNINKNHRNNKVNTSLQNFMYTMLRDPSGVAAKKSLDVMIELYKKNVWRDAKTVNVIASAALNGNTKMLVAVLKFFLGVDMDDESNDDSESEEDALTPDKVRHMMQGNVKSSAKAMRRLERQVSKKRRKENRALKTTTPCFSAIQLLHDAQDFADRLFSLLQKSHDRFEVKMMLMNVIARLIGSHELILLNFYPFLQKYMNPHQKEVTHIMAYAVNSVHHLVPPDVIEPMVMTIANQFVCDHNTEEAICVGLNTIREVCQRQPHVMNPTLLHDLTEYKSHRHKGVVVAARGLIGLFRDIDPSMLKKKDRGKDASMNEQTKVLAYGEFRPATSVDGVELLDAIDDEEEGEESEEGEEEGEENEEECSDDADIIFDDADDEEDDDDDEEDDDCEKGDSEGDEGEGDKEDDEEEEEEVEAHRKNKKDPPKLDGTESAFLTDEDFKRIKVAKLAKLNGETKLPKAVIERKRKRQESDDEDEDDAIDESTLPMTERVVEAEGLEGLRKRQKRSLEERLKSVLAGREGREKFGSRKGIKKTGGTTNRQKLKNKPLMQVLHKFKRRDANKSIRDKGRDFSKKRENGRYKSKRG